MKSRRARPPMPWRLGAAALLCAALVGCGTAPGGGDGSAGPRTASDQTDNARRAAVRLELAGGYFAQGKPEVALDEVKLALQADPGYAPAYNLRGLIYASMREDALAEESFQRAQQLDPRDGDVLHNQGWFRCQRNRFDEADALFVRALAQPQYTEQQRTLLVQGVCQARAQRLPEAEKTLLKAFELNPANLAVSVNLSEVLLRRNDLDRARFYVRRANADPETSTAQTLWLALRIEQRAGRRQQVEELGTQLRQRFPQSREAAAYERGQFDD